MNGLKVQKTPQMPYSMLKETKINCRKLSISHLWLFLTEKCNLGCSYCFYRHRSSKQKFNTGFINTIYDYFKNAKFAKFVISGGEALIDRKMTKNVIKRLRALENQKYILLQTNATLLDASMIHFLKNYNISLEIGLDGKNIANKHRKGIYPHLDRIKNNILLSRKLGINVHATMTVCPDNADKIFENFIFLLGLKIKKIEITPAAFTKWGENETALFKDNYRRVLKFACDNKLTNFIGIEYDRPIRANCTDLVVLPDGIVLPNWALLSLTKKLKSEYALFRLNDDSIHLKNSRLLQDLLADNRFSTYRRLSTSYAKLAWQHLKMRDWSNSFSNYSDICTFIEKAHQGLLS